MWTSKYIIDIDERDMSSYELINVVSDTPGVSDSINGRPVNVFCKRIRDPID